MHKTISILGSGWLGLPLANMLQESGYSISLSTRTPHKIEALKAPKIEPYVIDIELMNDNIQAFLKSDILIINITCKLYDAYKLLLNEIEKSTIKHVLFISSTSVYPSDGGLCKESQILEVETNLRRIEKLFTNNKEFDCTILRFAGLIGPKRHPGRFFITGKSVRDANAKVNLIHQVDSLLLIKAILQKQAWGEVFNGCADNHPTKRDYYSEMAISLGYEPPKCIEVDNSTTKVICNQKVKKQLEYQFVYPDLYQIVW